MDVITLLILVYIVGIVCVVVMKKIQPEDKLYPVWVVLVCVLYTLFIMWYLSKG